MNETATNRPETIIQAELPVVIVRGEEGEAAATLEQALQESRFWGQLETERIQSDLSKENFQILIKPDFEYYDVGGHTGTDPRMVEHLIALLHERGYTRVVVASGPDPADLWLENRDVLVLADLAGYLFTTPEGAPYDILNLGEEVVKENPVFPSDSILYREGISNYWLQSHFRINFARNKTDEEYYFALGLYNLLGILPLRARSYHYRRRLQPWELALDLAQNAGLHFTIIDGWVSNHGAQGSRFPNPLETRTFIAGAHLLLVDWAGALKMGLDPYASPLNAAALRRLGLPMPFRLAGDLSPYPQWKNISRLLRESTFNRNQQPLVETLSRAWLQQVNTELFPFKHVLDAQLNRWLAPLATDPGQHPLVHWALIGLNYFLANLQGMQESWKILYDKDRLYRRDVPLGISLEDFDPTDFEAIEHYILPLAQVAHQTPPDRNGLRWRYLDGSVLFEFSKVIRVPYTDFIEKVDIARAVELMYDNIGCRRQTVRQDEQGRVVHQAERDIYLPQPNWIVLFGGSYIDVGKIEQIRYGEHRQEIFWRTVGSANQSAEFDDGMVVFADDPGGTLVTIVARQKFALPLFWQVVDIDYLPALKDALVSDSYIRFFSRTMANFEAAVEGRDPRIGRIWRQDYGESGAVEHPLALEQLQDVWAMLAGLVSRLGKTGGDGATETSVDEYGYRHFSGTKPGAPEPADQLRGFMQDLGRAMQKDIQLLINLPKNKRP